MSIKVSKSEFNLRDKLNELDGKVPYEKMPSGSVIQVAYAETRTQQQSTSQSFINANNMFVDISPRFSTSQMIITVHTVAQISGNRARFDIHKSTTNSGISERISRHSNDNGQDYSISAFEGNNINHSVNFTIEDIPGTTDLIRYQLQFNNTGGSTTYVQGSYSVGTITVMEVKR
tara:strand:- start:427 stop:951 length:525 start_codon:yes stop_codon:yes gene_type:complete